MNSLAISPRNIPILYSTTFFASFKLSMPIWVLYLQQYLTYTQITFLVGYQFAIQLITELPTGAFADLLGKKAAIAIAYTLEAISIFLFPFSSTFTQFLVIYTLLGLSESFSSGSEDAIYYDTLKQDNRQEEFSFISSRRTFWIQIGLMSGAVLGGLISIFHPTLPFYLEAITHLISVALILMTIEPSIDTAVFTLKNYARQIFDGAKQILKNPHIRQVSFYYIIVGGITWSIQRFFNNALLVSLGFSGAQIGLTLGMLRVVNILILMKLLKLDRIFTKTRSILFFPVVMAIALLPGILLTQQTVIPFVAAAMMAATARWIILGKYTNDEFDSKYRATAISTLNMLVNIIFVALMFASGPVIDHYGGVKTFFSIMGLITILTVLPLGINLAKAVAKR